VRQNAKKHERGAPPDLRVVFDRIRKGREPKLGEVDMDAVRLMHRYMDPFARYFRFEARGFERIPKENTLIVANHSGGKIPIDIFLFGHGWYDHFGFSGDRRLYTLMHDILFAATFARRAFRRLGCVPAHPKNARALLEMGESVLVLPGGDWETFRPYSARNKIDFGRRTGFCDLALRARVPITPVVTVGSHEIFFVLTRGEKLAKYLGMKALFRYNAFPIILGFPMGLYFGPVPSPLPLPAKMTQEVQEPVYLYKDEHDHRAYSEKDLESEHTRLEMQRVVVGRMQRSMDRLAAERKLPVIG
jgi:1-acyl-sn-glycerol-3-phosphate acyltransferase